MDAIRIARASTGRDTVMKIFGSYHGHHDGVMVSIGVEYDQIGDRDNLASLPYGAGIPEAVATSPCPSRSTTRPRWSGGSSSSTPRAASPPA